jgi:hypothetical protein
MMEHIFMKIKQQYRPETARFIKRIAPLVLGCATGFVHADLVLSEDFESPDVSTVSAQTLPASGDWASNQSFNGIRKFIWDESYTYNLGDNRPVDGSTFSTPDGEQAYFFGYSSAVGITSLDGLVGPYTESTTATLDFLMGKASLQPGNGSGEAEILLDFFAVNPAGTNNRTSSNFGGSSGTDFLLLDSATFGESSSALQAKQWNLTLDEPSSLSTDVTGWDLALRIRGDNFNYPIIDNIQFDIATTAIPEPSSLVLIGLGSTMMLLLRRRGIS